MTLTPVPDTFQWDGTLDPEAVRAMHDRLRELESECLTRASHERQLERDVKGKRLQIGKLEEDREAQALARPDRPVVELLHVLWQRACNHPRAGLHFRDYERIGAAVRSEGFAVCLAAIAGAAYDPRYSDPGKNGKRQRFDSLELIYREPVKVRQFADRVPTNWQPTAAKVAEIGGVSEAWVAALLAGREIEAAA